MRSQHLEKKQNTASQVKQVQGRTSIVVKSQIHYSDVWRQFSNSYINYADMISERFETTSRLVSKDLTRPESVYSNSGAL